MKLSFKIWKLIWIDSTFRPAHLSQCVRARISMLNNDSSSLVHSSNFYENFRQTNCGVPLRIDTWSVLPKKQANICFEVLLPRSLFAFEDPHGGLLLRFGLIRIDPWFVTWDDLINVFWGAAIVFFQHFFTPIDTNLFLSGIQWEQIFFTARSSCNIQCMLVEELLMVCAMTILHYQFTHGKNVLWRLLLEDLHGPRLWVIVGYRMVLHRQTKI